MPKTLRSCCWLTKVKTKVKGTPSKNDTGQGFRSIFPPWKVSNSSLEGLYALPGRSLVPPWKVSSGLPGRSLVVSIPPWKVSRDKSRGEGISELRKSSLEGLYPSTRSIIKSKYLIETTISHIAHVAPEAFREETGLLKHVRTAIVQNSAAKLTNRHDRGKLNFISPLSLRWKGSRATPQEVALALFTAPI